jgi:hypothetical protein
MKCYPCRKKNIVFNILIINSLEMLDSKITHSFIIFLRYLKIKQIITNFFIKRVNISLKKNNFLFN